MLTKKNDGYRGHSDCIDRFCIRIGNGILFCAGTSCVSIGSCI
ncbi:hypothetical protein BAT02nite_34790 [Bacillus atrophaeus]|nr:hypothetical protein BAT02nite_34790 [Bacillus atrophaeus]